MDTKQDWIGFSGLSFRDLTSASEKAVFPEAGGPPTATTRRLPALNFEGSFGRERDQTTLHVTSFGHRSRFRYGDGSTSALMRNSGIPSFNARNAGIMDDQSAA
jgi:hypothetical protein